MTSFIPYQVFETPDGPMMMVPVTIQWGIPQWGSMSQKHAPADWDSHDGDYIHATPPRATSPPDQRHVLLRHELFSSTNQPSFVFDVKDSNVKLQQEAAAAAAKAKQEQEAKLKQEQEAAAAAEVKAKQEQDAKAKQEEEAKANQEEVNKLKADLKLHQQQQESKSKTKQDEEEEEEEWEEEEEASSVNCCFKCENPCTYRYCADCFKTFPWCKTKGCQQRSDREDGWCSRCAPIVCRQCNINPTTGYAICSSCYNQNYYQNKPALKVNFTKCQSWHKHHGEDRQCLAKTEDGHKYCKPCFLAYKQSF